MTVLQIGAEEVRERLSLPECIEAMALAMRAVSSGRFEAPQRRITPLEHGHFFLMPGSMAEGPVFGAKLISLVPGNPERSLPAVQGFIALFDHDSGTPLALVDGASITYLRTAATSALATQYLARKNAQTHGIFGAGVLAMEHLKAIACIREITMTRVWARDSSRAEAFADLASRQTGLNVVAASAQEAAACDIVTTVTNADEPVLLGQWLAPGSHLNLVGAHQPDHREADSDAVSQASVFVDTRESALKEAGDILVPMSEGRLGESAIRGEIGQVLEGEVTGRRNDEEITLFKSLGHVAQDIHAAERVYRRVADSRSNGQG